jgi:NADPH:quinone reductase
MRQKINVQIVLVKRPTGIPDKNCFDLVSSAIRQHINKNAHIPLWRQISLSNETQISTGLRIQPSLLSNSALIKGFLIRNYSDRFDKAIRHLADWLKEIKLKYSENKVEGLGNAPKAFIGLFTGENIGKQIVIVS